MVVAQSVICYREVKQLVQLRYLETALHISAVGLSLRYGWPNSKM